MLQTFTTDRRNAEKGDRIRQVVIDGFVFISKQ